MKRRNKYIKSKTELELKEHYKVNKFKCKRCESRFLTDNDLQNHRQAQHCEYTINDRLKNKKYKASFTDPKEKIIKLSSSKMWLWNPWRKEFFMYILGLGCISNKYYIDKQDNNRLKEMLLCDENSLYLKLWKGIILNKKPFIKEPVLESSTFLTKDCSKQKAKLPKEYTYCKNCNHPIRVIHQEFNDIICPCCGRFINKVCMRDPIKEKETIKTNKIKISRRL